MKLGSLTTALQQAATSIRKTQSATLTATARLSSGERITRAADDVAGLSIATSMLTKLSGMRRGHLNILQAGATLQVADGALREIGEALQRMNALATQANTGQLGTAERQFLDSEFQQLKAEIDRLLAHTEFGGKLLFRSSDARDIRNVAQLSATIISAPITPPDLDDLAVWLDASDVTTIEDAAGLTPVDGGFTGEVRFWRDKSGNNNDVGQGNAAERPQYAAGALAGMGGVRFDGNNDRLPGTVPMASNELTTFIIATRTGGGATREFFLEFGSNGDGHRDIVGLQSSTPTYYNGSPGTNNWNFTGTINYGDFNLYSTRTDNTDLEGYIDGTQRLDLDIGPYDRDPTTAFVVGDDSTSGDELHGDIIEVVAYDRALTQAQRQQIEGYLMHKYGLQANLPASHPYAESPPTLGGVGYTLERDDVIDGARVALLNPSGPGANLFEIASGNDDGAFAINRSTGEITIANASLLTSQPSVSTVTVAITDNLGVPQYLDITIDLLFERITDRPTEFSYQLSTESTESFRFDLGEIYLEDMFGTTSFDITTQTNAASAFDTVRRGIDYLTGKRAQVGAAQAQSDYIEASIASKTQTHQAAYAVLADTDIARESTAYALTQSKQQLSIATLAQGRQLRTDVVSQIFEDISEA